ncbi:MAG: hypothetical protein ACJZ8O_06150 [Pirellulaceae bacterium]
MSIPMTSGEVLDREYLEIRAKILQLAASFDRLDRADGDVSSDDRSDLIRKGLEILQSSDDNRAEQIQLLFSREYEDVWREQFGI